MRALKAIWCRIFHRYTGHIGFSSRGKTEWVCFKCGHEWVAPAQPDKLRTKPTTGK